jgi:hypothetical protein
MFPKYSSSLIHQKSNMTPIFWLSGNYYERNKKWGEICSKIGNPLIEIVDTDFVVAENLIMLVRNRDMFDRRPRIIKVKGIPERYEILPECFDQIDNENVLVFDSPVGRWSNRRFVNLKNTSFYKSIVNISSPPPGSRIFHFKEDFHTEIEACEWLLRIADEKKKKISPESCKTIIEAHGLNADVLYGQIIKLCCFQKGKEIKGEDIQECCISDNVKTVWVITDTLLSRNLDDTLSVLQSFYAEASLESSFSNEVQSLLSAMMYVVNFVCFIKGSVVTDISEIPSVFAKITKNVNGGQKQVYDQYSIQRNLKKDSVQKALQWPIEKIYDTIYAISQIRLSCRDKYGENSSIKTSLDTLAMAVCGKITYKQWESINVFNN